MFGQNKRDVFRIVLKRRRKRERLARWCGRLVIHFINQLTKFGVRFFCLVINLHGRKQVVIVVAVLVSLWLYKIRIFLKLVEDLRSSNIDFCANKHLEISLKCSGKTKETFVGLYWKEEEKEKIGSLMWKVGCSFHQSFCECWRQIFLLED